MTRKVPLTVKECIPGDVIDLPSGQGKVVVTGPNIGKTGTYRLVRPADRNNNEAGREFPIPTTLLVVRVHVLKDE